MTLSAGMFKINLAVLVLLLAAGAERVWPTDCLYKFRK
jgi:hypothetical protein